MWNQMMKILLVPLLFVAATLPVAMAQPNLAPTAPQAGVATGPVLTLSAATDRAMSANPDIRIAERELSALEAAVGQASLLPNPSLELLREGHDEPTRTSTIQLSIPVELGGKRTARRNAAGLDADMARQELAAVRARIHADAVWAFYELYLAGERVRLAQASAETAKGASQATSRRVTAGKISPVEETRARVAESAVRIELLQAQRHWEEARARMAAMWGPGAPPIGAVAEPAETLPVLVSLQELESRIEGSPGLAKARLEVERRRALAQVEKSRGVPNVAVIVGAKREGPDNRRLAVVGVSVPIPLFDRNQGAVLEALRRTDKARDELAAAGVRLRSELVQAHARLSAALQEVALLCSDILPGAQSAADAASKGFELGKFSFLEVLDAQRTLFQSKTQYVHAIADAHRAAADIARVFAGATIVTAMKSQEKQ
jgi:cobalt-zinc-cadmium efflux system outer membrane protein